MNKGELVYLDTSVISAYFDTRVEPRMKETKDFFNSLSKFSICISDLVIEELSFISDSNLKNEVLKFIRSFRILPLTDEAEFLAEEYIEEGIFSSKYFGDSLHIAIATINNVNVLVSWNFEHIVKRKTKIKVNYINALKGYKPIDIVSPLDF